MDSHLSLSFFSLLLGIFLLGLFNILSVFVITKAVIALVTIAHCLIANVAVRRGLATVAIYLMLASACVAFASKRRRCGLPVPAATARAFSFARTLRTCFNTGAAALGPPWPGRHTHARQRAIR